MAQENVDRFLEATEAWNNRDMPRLLELLDPEIRADPRQAVLQGSSIGHDGVSSFMADIDEHYEGSRIRYDEIRDLGDRVLAFGAVRITGMSSGIETEVPVAIVAEFRDGLMTRFRDYGNQGKALEAAELDA
jgi:ketosteroid isomerase-like protein